jgi:uncharacterized membrane protein YphA (DoxX/SURF4 family)
MSKLKSHKNTWAPLPLRLILGFGFIAHGWAKLSRGPAVASSNRSVFLFPTLRRE